MKDRLRKLYQALSVIGWDDRKGMLEWLRENDPASHYQDSIALCDAMIHIARVATAEPLYRASDVKIYQVSGSLVTAHPVLPWQFQCDKCGLTHTYEMDRGLGSYACVCSCGNVMATQADLLWISTKEGYVK